jgi:SAM-dependent methyltransferase
MSFGIEVIRRFEEYILAEQGFPGQGSIDFEYRGEAARGYPYVRSGHQRFEEGLDACLMLDGRPAKDWRFLKVGCGIGTKCGLAHFRGLQVTGIDLLPAYLAIARAILPEITFDCQNALDFEYFGYDLIFYHVRLAQDHLMEQLEWRILSQMKVGAILLTTKWTTKLQTTLFENNEAQVNSFEQLSLNAGRLVCLKKLAD